MKTKTTMYKAFELWLLKRTLPGDLRRNSLLELYYLEKEKEDAFDDDEYGRNTDTWIELTSGACILGAVLIISILMGSFLNDNRLLLWIVSPLSVLLLLIGLLVRSILKKKNIYQKYQHLKTHDKEYTEDVWTTAITHIITNDALKVDKNSSLSSDSDEILTCFTFGDIFDRDPDLMVENLLAYVYFLVRFERKFRLPGFNEHEVRAERMVRNLLTRVFAILSHQVSLLEEKYMPLDLFDSKEDIDSFLRSSFLVDNSEVYSEHRKEIMSKLYALYNEFYLKSLSESLFHVHSFIGQEKSQELFDELRKEICAIV